MGRSQASTEPDPAAVLSKATVRAARGLDLPGSVLARVIGTSEASVSRLGAGRMISPASKEGELAILFLRLYRSLDAMLGGDAEHCRGWLSADNVHLGGRPIDLIQTAAGLVHVTDYLDAMRGAG